MTPRPEAAASARTVPGWALRVAVGAACLTATLTAVVPAPPFGVSSVLGVLLVAASVGAALAPGSVLPLVVLIGAIVSRAATPGPVLDAGLAALLMLLPLIHQLAGVSATVPPRSACHWQALRPAAVRYSLSAIPLACVVVVAHMLAM
jgi:hypothetical protein